MMLFSLANFKLRSKFRENDVIRDNDDVMFFSSQNIKILYFKGDDRKGRYLVTVSL